MIFRRNESFEYSVKDKRKMTSFFAKELLFDYATNSLDAQRLIAMKSILADSAELRAELDNISYGISYAEQLCQTIPSPELLKRMEHPPSYLGIIKQKIQFNRWPLTVRWFAEALVIGGIVSLVITLLPWHRLMNAIEKNMNEAVVIAELMKTPDAQEMTDESAEPVTVATAPPPTGTSTIKIPKIEFPKVSIIPKPAPTAAPVPATPKPTAQGPTSPAPTTPVATATVTSTTEIKSTAIPQGFLYRGTLTVLNIDPTTQKIVEEVQNLGGKKAGGVPLGWAKENERYFHFTLPIDQLEVLQTKLGTYGKLKISKEKHERVMPEGIARLIVSVYEEQKPVGP